LSTLRRYNRPVILTLTARDGRKRDVLLRTLTEDVATLQIGEIAVRVALDDLTRAWTGDYLMVWRLQTSSPLIGPKSWGGSVQWLRQRLALAEGTGVAPDEPVSMEFDEDLGERIKHFQRAHGLVPDGLVGEFTMPLLNNEAPAPGTPLLDSSPVARIQ
jgi:general secretion pathway protein A